MFNFIFTEKEISFRDCTKVETAAADEEGVRKEEQKMPGRVVMMKLILVVVGRKLFRNPNTYSSALGLLWSLISFKYATPNNFNDRIKRMINICHII